MSWALLVVVTACGAGERDAFAPVRTAPDDVLRFNAYDEPSVLDPALVNGIADERVVQQLFEGLVTLHPDTLAPQPGMAASWTSSSDQLTYTFRLRDDAHWSDGRPVRAHDFVAGMERALRPSTQARHAERLYVLQNAEAYHHGQVARIVGRHVRPRRPPFVIEHEDLTRSSTLASLATFAESAVVDLLDSNLRRSKGGPLPMRAEAQDDAPIVATLLPHHDALVLGKTHAPRRLGDRKGWVQLRLPGGGQAGWVPEAQLLPVFPELNLRRVEGERRFGSRAPLRSAPEDAAAPVVWLDDNSEVEVLERVGEWVLVQERIDGRAGYIRTEYTDNEYGDRHWLLVRTQLPPGIGGDGRPMNASIGWLPARELFRSADLVGVRAVDDKTLRLQLERPAPTVLTDLAAPPFFPVPERALRRHGDSWTRLDNFVSNGPFVLHDRIPGDSMVLRKNPRHPDHDRISLREVQLLFVVDEHTALDLFRTGAVDALAAGHLPIEVLSRVQQSASFRSTSLRGTYAMRLNTQKPPLDDQRVRQAFALAVDKQALAATLLKRPDAAAAFLVPADLLTVDVDDRDTDALALRQQRARALLAEAGYPNGQGLPPIEVLFHTSAHHRVVAEVLQAMWKNVLNVDVLLVNQEWKTFINRVELGDYHLARADFFADDSDPLSILSALTQSSGRNHTGFAHAAYDDLLFRAQALPRSDARDALLRKAQRILVDEVPVLPLFVLQQSTLVLPDVHGLTPNALGQVWFRHVHIGAAAKTTTTTTTTTKNTTTKNTTTNAPQMPALPTGPTTLSSPRDGGR